MTGDMIMTILNPMGEQFAFWLVQSFLISQEDQTDETRPLTNAHAIVIGTVILVVLVILRLLVSR